MADVTSTAPTPGLDFVSANPAGANWEEFTFPAWVRRVGIRTLSGTVYVSRSAEGAFNASGTNFLTVPVNSQWIGELEPAGGRFGRISALRLAHSDGAAGVIEFELLG